MPERSGSPATQSPETLPAAATAGGLYDEHSSSTTISGSGFANNASLQSAGGGLAIFDGTTVNVHSTTITGNFAHGGGGALLNAITSITANNLTVTANQSGDNGGGILFDGGATLTARGDTFTGNDSLTDGGGILISTGLTGSVSGAIVTGNSAANGGGIYNLDIGTVTVSGNITGNVAIAFPNIN
jgi:predicted outer membrane repeat protein